MKIPLDAVKSLREKTGAPIGDVRSALEAAGGDETKAREFLKQKGFEAAKTRMTRAAGAGRIECYIHHDGRVGALVEVNCETDFVARLPEFQQLCKDLAMQVASQNPHYVKKDELTGRHLAETKQRGKTPDELAKDACLLEQPFIKDQGQTIAQLLTAMIAKTGENIVVRRFMRFALGEPR
jgi:elongation factor Ts